MRQRVKGWVLFALRWGIAIAGIWWVLSRMSWSDRVLVLDEHNRPVEAILTQRATEKDASFAVVDPHSGQHRTVGRDQTVNPPDRPGYMISALDGRRGRLLALDLSDDMRTVRRLLIEAGPDGRGMWLAPNEVRGGYQVQVPHPRVRVGIGSLLHRARPGYLWAAVLVFPVVYFITAARWHMLLKALDIRLRFGRTFVLSMVGAFYNAFLPGMTGGDILKAYYASRQTPHRIHAVLSVLVDRVLGLLALMTLGGVAAAYIWLSSATPDDAATRTCRHTALVAAVLVAGAAGGAALFAINPLRRALGLEFVLSRLPMQRQISHVRQAMRRYRSRPLTVLAALAMTVPVDVICIVSTMLAGMAFGLPVPPMYYFVLVPVMLLTASLPISPQGAGVMEFFAVQFTRQYGATVSQAFALAMSVRLIQIVWNLTGGIFVLRGGYHVPTRDEQEEMERDEEQ